MRRSRNGDSPSETRYGYDEGGRITAVCQELDSGNCGQTRTFLYDDRGYLLSETHPEKGGASANGTVSYLRYDSGAMPARSKRAARRAR